MEACGTSSKKSKKRQAIALVAPGGCGGLGQLWEALAGLWEGLGQLWEALYIDKLPINRTSGRYAIISCGSTFWSRCGLR